jgi:hypothetical protein
LKAEQESRAQAMQAIEAASPISTAIGGALPAMAIPIGGVGVGAASLAGRAALAGAAPEALSYGTVGERAANAALGGAGGAIGAGAGLALGKGIQAIGRPFGNVNPQRIEAAKVLESYGVPVRADQATGSRNLQLINSALDNLPFTSGSQQRFRQDQGLALNAAANKMAGINGNVADEAARVAARDSIGRGYTEVAGRNAINEDALRRLLTEGQNIYAKENAPLIKYFQNKIIENVDNGKLKGDIYKRIDSEMGRNMGRGTPDVRDMRTALRKAMEDSIRPEDAGAWKALDKQYASLGAISKSADDLGNISPAKLYTATRDKSIVRAGRDEIGELATAAKILPEMTGNPGTAQRAMWQNILTGAAVPGLFGGGGYYLGDGNTALGAGGLAAAGLFAPKLTQKAINSKLTRRVAERGIYDLPDKTVNSLGLLGTLLALPATGSALD